MNKQRIKMILPEDVKNIINTIEAAGYEAYAVGGCVRDSVLGRTPSDWDITTSALPMQVKALFSHTIDTGIQHGTVTVMLNHEGYEVTTYRIDGEYEDSRHPKKVSFTANLEEDLKRRDFTINAMAYNDREGLVDVFDGIGDLARGVIQAVGNPRERFTEDALRMMRAVRFAAQLGYTIEEQTKQAMTELAPTLNNISAERIQVELVKLVKSPHPDWLRLLYETGISAVIMPEFDAIMETEQHNPHHCYTVGEHTLHAMLNIPDHAASLKELRLAMLFHDFGKACTKTTDEDGIDHFHGHAAVSADLARSILKRLKFDNDTIHTVSKLVYYHDYKIEEAPKYVRRAIHRIGEDLFPLILQVKRADFMAQSDYKRQEKENSLAVISTIYADIQDKSQCVSLKTLEVKGKDLIAEGISPGRQIGVILDAMLEFVIDQPEYNTKEYLLQHLSDFKETK
jgi:tRNA nucleotidyltransferase (CCA-adding enzyme)